MPELSIEAREWIYDFHGTITMILSLVLCILYGKKYKYRLKELLCINAVWWGGVFVGISQLWTKLDLLLFGHGSIVAARSIILLPVPVFILAKLLKRSVWNICDYVTPFYFFCHGFATIACWIYGCCAGREWPVGIVNPRNGLTVFPTQPLIIAFSMLITVVTLWYARKYSYKANGKVYALGMVLYGCFRYVLELFSDDLRIISVLSLNSLYSITMVLTGLLLFYFIDNPLRFYSARRSVCCDK